MLLTSIVQMVKMNITIDLHCTLQQFAGLLAEGYQNLQVGSKEEPVFLKSLPVKVT